VALVSCLRGIVVPELIPFFDECLPVSDILPRIRSELKTALARIPQDSPEYAKLQNLQIVLSSEFASIAREVVGNSEKFWSSCSMSHPAGYSQRDIELAHAAETEYFASLDRFNGLLDSVEF